jgi:cyanate permease
LLSLGLPLRSEISFYGVALIIGPLMGSFITEPAAMTVTALVLSLALWALLPTLVAMACFWWLPSL